MTKKEQILNHLKKGYSITPQFAYQQFHSMRLGAIIWELIQEGYYIINVQDDIKYPENAHYSIAGQVKEKTHYGEYVMIFEKEKKVPATLFD